MVRVRVQDEVFDIPAGMIPGERFRELVKAGPEEVVYRVAPDGSFLVVEPGQPVEVREGDTYGKVVPFIAAGADLTPAEEATLERACRQVLLPCRRAGVPGPVPLGLRPLPPGPVAVTGRPYAWLVYPLEEDPLYRDGGLPLPEPLYARLQRLARTGVALDACYIAHEVPRGALKGARPEALREALEPPPDGARRAGDLLGRAGLALLEGALGLPLLRRALRSPRGAAGLAAAPLAVGLVLDPVLLGAVTWNGSRTPGTPAYWFLLGAWRWPRPPTSSTRSSPPSRLLPDPDPGDRGGDHTRSSPPAAP